ncbi:NAD(P)H-flavin reductase [Alteromonas sp. 345S023]|jgi:aquacobalamin reductase/NAD(P)H-flavin reductase|uniref:NAD(P)H-flavin reductase n=1 Tax=Alteromonas profundi TaxID=2696062 RepID=A0A7X5LLU1_9ALTE|nr:NAD(P)H-flavin reductase [Alteromonas profundi]NDV91745.1 NAD(P)H-flavin reductase [Alteromonas profundi]
MSEIKCQVASITPLTDVVYKIELTPPAPVEFKAGQYAMVKMGEKDLRPFSIANAAYDNERIELHIGAEPGNSYATEVLTRMQEDGEITLSANNGQAFLQSNGLPMVLIAGGTGFSYTYSILQQHLHSGDTTPITLYWGGKHASDLYLSEQLTELAEKYAHFTFVPVVEFAHDDWQGRTGWVHHAVMADHADFAAVQVYVAGRFEMAKTVRDDLTVRGLKAENLFGDAFAFI